MSTIVDAVQAAAARITSRLEAELLMGHSLNRDRAWLYAHARDDLDPDQRSRFEALVLRRQRGEPIAYITGSREFYGRDFLVSPAVLIPRPETELLVDLALARLPQTRCRVVDVGTGSGCIALTLAAERPGWQITAVDISPAALEVCASNSQRLGLEQVRLLQGDLLGPVQDEPFDAIVSNPPYVAANDPHLEQGDLRFEPQAALSAGPMGLAVIDRLIDQATGRLRPGGWLMLEHGHDQGRAVVDRMLRAGLHDVRTHPDLAGVDRVTLGQRPAASRQQNLQSDRVMNGLSSRSDPRARRQ